MSDALDAKKIEIASNMVQKKVQPIEEPAEAESDE